MDFLSVLNLFSLTNSQRQYPEYPRRQSSSHQSVLLDWTPLQHHQGGDERKGKAKGEGVDYPREVRGVWVII